MPQPQSRAADDVRHTTLLLLEPPCGPQGGAPGAQEAAASMEEQEQEFLLQPQCTHALLDMPLGPLKAAAPCLLGRGRMRRHQLFLAIDSVINLIMLLLLVPDVGVTLLLSVTASCLLALFGVLPRLAVPLNTSGHMEAILSRRTYRCCAVVASSNVATLVAWVGVLALMVRDPDQAMHDALPVLVAVGCALLALHAGLAVVVAKDAASLVRHLDTTGTKVRWATWLLLGAALALSLLVTGAVAAFLLLVMGSADCMPSFTTNFYD